MKKFTAVLVSAALLLGCAGSALAVESAEDGAMAEAVSTDRTLGYYASFGPYRDWTEEQTAEAETWTEEEWFTYWDWYYDWSRISSYEFYDDYDAWYTIYFEDAYTEWDPSAYLAEIKEYMGMPYPYGLNVELNDSYLDFGETEPISAQNRVMVPYRPLLEAMGASVTAQNGTLSAAFQNGNTLTLSVGSTTLSYTRDGKAAQLEMDVAPMEQDGTVYIPVSFVAQSMGYTVSWDDYYRVVTVYDWAGLEDALDARFTNLNALMSAYAAMKDYEQTYASTDVLSLSGTLYGETENDTATISLHGNSLVKGQASSGAYTLTIDLGGLKDTIFSGLPQEALDTIDRLTGGKLSMISNPDDQQIYFKGDFLETLTDGMLPNNQWISYDMPAPGQWQLSQATSIGQILVTYARQMGASYQETEQVGIFFSLFLGDEALTATTSGGVTTYSAKTNLTGLLTAAQQNGLITTEDLQMIMQSDMSLPALTLELTAAEQGGVLTCLDFTANFDLSSINSYYYGYYSYYSLYSYLSNALSPSNIDFHLSLTPESTDLSLAFRGDYVGRVDLTISRQSEKSSESVPAAPPAGESISSYEALENAYYEALWSDYDSDEYGCVEGWGYGYGEGSGYVDVIVEEASSADGVAASTGDADSAD